MFFLARFFATVELSGSSLGAAMSMNELAPISTGHLGLMMVK